MTKKRKGMGWKQRRPARHHVNNDCRWWYVEVVFIALSAHAKCQLTGYLQKIWYVQ